MNWITGIGTPKTGRASGMGMKIILYVSNQYREQANEVFNTLRRQPVRARLARVPEGLEKADAATVMREIKNQQSQSFEIQADVKACDYAGKGGRKIEFYLHQDHVDRGIEMMNILHEELSIWALTQNNQRLAELEDDVTQDQMRMIYALIGDIADYQGEDPDDEKVMMLKEFDYGFRYISDMKKHHAMVFISYMLRYCSKNEIPLVNKDSAGFDDQTRQFVNALYLKRCLICGNPGTAGQWKNGLEQACLCDKHWAEVAQLGYEKFEQRHHMRGIEIKV